MVDVKPTCEIIRSSAETLRRYASELDKISDKMLETCEIDMASDALNAITNCFANLRIDLLAARPIRAFVNSQKDCKSTEARPSVPTR
jgi:hypothetical protein